MKKLIKQFVVAGSIAGLAVSSYAIPTMRVSDGVNSVTIGDGGAAVIVGAGSALGGGDINGLGGVVTFSGTVGAWVLNVDTGVSKPFSGSAVQPKMDLHFLASGGVGTLTIEFSDDFFGPTTAAFKSSIGGTTDGSVSWTTLLDPANGLFAGAVLTGPQVFGPGGAGFPYSGSASGAASGANPFSLTMQVAVTHALSSDLTSGNAALQAVPDGGTTLVLLGSGLTALGFLRRKLSVKA